MTKDCFEQVRIKKVPGLFKDKLGEKINTEVAALRAKTYAQLINGYGDDDDDDDDEKNKINKKAKGTKKCVIKRRLMFENYKDCLLNDKTILISQQRFNSDNEERLKLSDRVTTYPYGANEFELCEDEMLNVFKAKETFKILSKDCENYLYVTCNIFSNCMKTKCARELRKYVKFASKKCKV